MFDNLRLTQNMGVAVAPSRPSISRRAVIRFRLYASKLGITEEKLSAHRNAYSTTMGYWSIRSITQWQRPLMIEF